MVDLKYIVIYETWQEYEEPYRYFLGLFDTEDSAIEYMQKYANFQNLGHPKLGTGYPLENWYSLPKDTLGEEYLDGHSFRIKKVPHNPNPEVPY